MNRKSNILGLLIVSMSACVYGKDKASVPQVVTSELENPMVIGTPITRETMDPLMTHLARGVVLRTLPSKITLVINSPGGVVYTGFQFVALMHAAQAQGVKFHCIVPSLAASMAFHIFTQCDTREALPGAHLLWHRARTVIGGGGLLGGGGTVMTTVNARTLAVELAEIDDSILDSVFQALGDQLPAEEIKFAFDNEIMHIAYSLELQAPAFLKTSKHVPGLLEALASPQVLRTASPENVKTPVKVGGTRGNTPVYIWEEAVQELLHLLSPSSSN